jgi:GAF domain-containing protein
MSQMDTAQVVQLIAWIITLIEFIMGLYILLLNFRSRANQHVAFLLILISINTYAQGSLLTAVDVSQLRLTLFSLAATTPAIQPGLLLIAVILLKPEWMRGRWRGLWWLVYGMVALPIILTLLDYFTQTSIWFTGYQAANYAGGFVNLQTYTQGLLGVPLRIFFIYGITVVSVIPILYVAFFDKSITKITRNLAFVLLTTQTLAILINFILFSVSPSSYYAVLITSTIFAVGYTYAAFWQLISERRLQRGRLQIRLSAVILVISLPLMVATSTYILSRTGALIRQNALQRLEDIDHAISSTVLTWLDFNNKALDAMVTLPDIVSMDPVGQKPVLEKMALAYPHMYLVSTLDLDGMNVARSDDAPLTDYSDRSYYQHIRSGAPSAQQTLIGRTSGVPALVVAKPIRNNAGELIGVGFFASTLEIISEAIQIGNIGSTGIAFVVDENNQVIAHPDPQYITEELRDFSLNPAVASMRQSDSKIVRYKSDDGVGWYATYQELDNGWGVIVQQSEKDFAAAYNAFQTVVWIITGIGIFLLGILTSLAIRQAIQPIETLTETATAITQGELGRIAPVESEDEIGVLAQAFNQMTEQLLESIGNLERRVFDRTRDLEQRSNQLLAAADVGRAASSVLDIDQLIHEVVGVIRERFELYYVGLFLVDEAKEWALLRAGTGEAGAIMLSRHHRIRVGQGMIGWSIANAQPRVALEAGKDAVRLATSELPETRSEAAIPLRVRGQTIGAITVQDTQPDRFDEASIASLQTMADLVSVAIDNARLYTETQVALETSRRAYGEASSKSWQEQIQKAIGFRSTEQGTRRFDGSNIQMGDADDRSSGKTLSVPIKVRDIVVGELITRKSGEGDEWYPEEITMIESIVEQLGVALEGARLYEETQRRAAYEQLTREISTRIRETLDIENVLQTSTFELRHSIDLEEVEVRLGILPEDNQVS